jgi:hypothetical protein
MRLDSVRELKKSLPALLEHTFAAKRAVTTGPASMAVASAASRRRVAPSFFLGVSLKGRNEYRLAVRLQDHALERSALIAEISARAKGEVDVRYVGSIRARSAWYRSRQRPLLMGASVGYLATAYNMAGTLGCFVSRKGTSGLHILSNNHVLADENRYHIGKPIVQPGTLDQGDPVADRVAKLTAFIKLKPTGANHVDCAIAKLNAGIEPDTSKLKGLGQLSGVRAAALDIQDAVHKVGRTTGLRHGRVTAIELDGVTVEYDIGVVSFDDQVEIEGSGTRSFSDAGDSGSLIVDGDLDAAALLFAGSDHGGTNGKGLTYANPIHAVLRALKVKIVY